MHNNLYDSIDIRNSYNSGFWIGTVAGVLGTFITCFLIGILVY